MAQKVNDIVADVLQRMLVQKYLEERIGGIFDRYKKEWFGNDGSFKGIDAVIGSMNGFAGELNQVGEEFNAIYQGLSDSLKKTISREMRNARERARGSPRPRRIVSMRTMPA